MEILIYAIVAVFGLGGGYVFATTVLRKNIEQKSAQLLREAEAESEVMKKDKMLQAKERFLQLKTEHEKSIQARNNEVAQSENRAKQKESMLSQKLEETKRKQTELDTAREGLNQQLEVANKKQAELDKQHRKQVEQLEIIAGLSADAAKNQLVEALKEEAKTEAASHIKDIIDESRLTANKEAKRIVVQTIQRVATEHAVENSVSVFNIENDEVKGRIIGREGRNIRAIEAATGVEIIVDDTPEAIILSCFDPIRREVARLALHVLVTDGRIHPARIEEVVAKTKRQIEEEIVETGKRTCIDLGIHGLHPELTRMVGRMKYRSSYGQNLLQHSREVANLCAIMAA